MWLPFLRNNADEFACIACVACVDRLKVKVNVDISVCWYKCMLI